MQPKQVCVLFCALALAMSGSPAPALAGPGAKHMPVEVVRDAKGDPVRTFEGRMTTSNWSGYALSKFATGTNYTAAQATWIVPQVFYQGFVAASSSWVGIGGFCKHASCKHVDRTLIQLGTEQDALADSVSDYYAWYEMLPAASIRTALVVNPGDTITASLSCAGKCRNNQSWTLRMTNLTSGASWSQVFRYNSSKLSVDLIEEAPSDARGILPLADFGTATFSDASANMSGADLSKGDSVVMENTNGQSSNVSAPDSTMGGFNACFSSDSTLAPCASP